MRKIALCLLTVLTVSVLIASDGVAQTSEEVRIGIIGLDTPHSLSFTKIFNAADPGPELAGFDVVAAYPKGNPAIASSDTRSPRYTEDVQALGVEIVGSIDELLPKVDAVMIETDDGRPHPDQVLPVLKANKPVFIDKPLASSLEDVIRIFEASAQYDTPVFSSSSLRYTPNVQSIVDGQVGKVLGADTYSTFKTKKEHPDLYYYGIHGVEMLYTLLGPGCETVTRVHSDSSEVVVGKWADGRIGTYRGLVKGQGGYGGTAYGTDGIAPAGPYEGMRLLAIDIAEFFRTGEPPVQPEEIIEIYAFMEAADESKRLGGEPVSMDQVLTQARVNVRR